MPFPPDFSLIARHRHTEKFIIILMYNIPLTVFTVVWMDVTVHFCILYLISTVVFLWSWTAVLKDTADFVMGLHIWLLVWCHLLPHLSYTQSRNVFLHISQVVCVCVCVCVCVEDDSSQLSPVSFVQYVSLFSFTHHRRLYWWPSQYVWRTHVQTQPTCEFCKCVFKSVCGFICDRLVWYWLKQAEHRYGYVKPHLRVGSLGVTVAALLEGWLRDWET